MRTRRSPFSSIRLTLRSSASFKPVLGARLAQQVGR